VNIDNLYARVVGVKPVRVDWGELREAQDNGAEDLFSYYEAFTHSDDEGRDWTLINTDGSTTHVVVDGKAWDLSDYDTLLDEVGIDTDDDIVMPANYPDEETFRALADVEPMFDSSEGPQVNYWYSLESDNADGADLAARLGVTSLCVVEVGGRFGLALTGGGMDMTWDIADAFIRLGLLPPVHFADLPTMAGLSRSDVNLRVVAAMRRSLTVTIERAQRDLTRLDQVEASLVGGK
jgi:hypothetical protein